MHKVLDRTWSTAASYLEVQPRYGRSPSSRRIAFLGGRSVAIVANNPSWFGAVRSIASAAAIKAMDFLDNGRELRAAGRCSSRTIRASWPGTKAEREGILKWGGKMFRAERRIKAPKIHVTVRKAFGFGMVTMAGTPFDRQTLSFALPGVNLASMPAGTGGKAAKLSEEQQREAEAAQTAGPYRMATGMGVDDVIDPRDLRNALLSGLMLAEGRDESDV